MKIKEVISSRAEHVEVVGRIMKKETIALKPKKLAKATLKDETGSITLNLWRDQVDQCQVGDLVKVSDAYVKSFRGDLELNTWKNIEVLERGEQNP